MGLFRKKSPPQNTTQQAAQSPRSRFNPMWAHTYVREPQPDAGGMRAYAFNNCGLAEFSPIGAAVANRKFWRVFQPVPLFAMFGTTQQGLGGLVMGGIYGTPLITPQDTSQEIPQ